MCAVLINKFIENKQAYIKNPLHRAFTIFTIFISFYIIKKLKDIRRKVINKNWRDWGYRVWKRKLIEPTPNKSKKIYEDNRQIVLQKMTNDSNINQVFIIDSNAWFETNLWIRISSIIGIL